MSEELIKQLIKSCPKDKIDVELPVLINKAANTLTLVEKCNTEIDDEIRRHEALLKKLRSNLSSIRRDCTHAVKTYHGDPSGNNDSCYICDICGAEI